MPKKVPTTKKPPVKSRTSAAPSPPKHAGGRPPKYSTPEEMQAVVDDYFESCWVEKITETENKETGEIITSNVRYQNRPYTMAGLAYHLEMTTQGVREYGGKDEFSCIVKRAKQKVEMSWEEQLYDGKGSGPIFWLKNHAGYRDKQEHELPAKTGPR